MQRLAAVLVIVLVGLAPASLARAQIGPNVPEPLTEPPPPPPPAPNAFDDDRGLSTLQKLLIFGGAVLVLGTIATVIVRDARKAAPPDERRHGSGSGSGAKAAGTATAKSTAERRRQQRAKRAKAKHARQQRKRNRPR